MSVAPQTLAFTIQAGDYLSNGGVGIAIPGEVLGFSIPADWTAANLSFQTSINNGPYVELYRENNPYILFVQPSSYSAENKSYWAGVTLLIIRSGTSAVPVPQTDTVTVLVSYLPNS